MTATATLDGVSKSSTASVTVNPDPLNALSLAGVTVVAGSTQQLDATATDQHGNILTDLTILWTVLDQNAGSISSTGILTAGEVAQTFAGAVRAQTTQGSVTQIATANVTITPGPLEQVVIAPGSVELGIGMIQQYVAVGADQFGNRLSGLIFTWSVEASGGDIGATTGLFTAGTTPGSYVDTVKTTTPQGGITRSDTGTVTVLPDRVAYILAVNYDQWDVYIADWDNANSQLINAKRLTETPAPKFRLGWSPDGKRIVFGSFSPTTGDGILAMNDDGSWTNLLLANTSSELNLLPAWSPYGSKIAFIRLDAQSFDLFMMDVDGSDVIQLANTSGAGELAPAWSPDSTKIAYDFTDNATRTGDIWVGDVTDPGFPRKALFLLQTFNSSNESRPSFSPDGTNILFESTLGVDLEIWVAAATGFNPVQLTSNDVIDEDAAWSPDGTKILFVSTRDGTGDAAAEKEIYIMDADGSNVIRLTTNTAIDSSPRWAPRKRGIDVTEDSVVIPGASTLQSSTTQAVAADAQPSVVRIRTDIGSGSGFIVGSTGLVLTNNHVISGADAIQVWLDGDDPTASGRVATVVGADLLRDLAVLQIDSVGLPTLELGALSSVDSGDQIVVMGFPGGATVIVLTIGDVTNTEFYPSRNVLWLETNADIAVGSSGGPLLNLQGQVIGVVTAKSVTLGLEDVGFAISANTLRIYLDRLKAGEVISN